VAKASGAASASGGADMVELQRKLAETQAKQQQADETIKVRCGPARAAVPRSAGAD
jgi:hypothetical protein